MRLRRKIGVAAAVAKEVVQRLGPDSSRDEFVLAINQCAAAGDLEQGRAVHAKITERRRLGSATFLANHLVKMYGDCGDAAAALAVFARIQRRNIFSWNLAIAACAGNDRGVCLYRSMLLEGQLPDTVTFVNLLSALPRPEKAILENAIEGGAIADVVVATAVVSLYGRLGCVDLAKAVFDAMPERNLVSWTAMITAYAQAGHCSREAIDLYFQMTRTYALIPDRVTFISLLESCTSGSLALRDGAVIEREIIAHGLAGESSVAVALITMYARCGGLSSARSAFDRALGRGNIGTPAWTAMIAAYAQHVHLQQTVEIHRLMALDGHDCDAVTFVNLLFACSHSGKLDDAWKSFLSMRGDFYVETVLDHYACMVDLLARLGNLDDADDLAANMPFEPVESVWMSLATTV